MSLVDELRFEISRTINTLRRRYASTADKAEEKSILEAIDALNGKLAELDQAALLQAAGVLADATELVEQAIAAARKGPFDGYLAAMEEHLNRLYRLAGDMHAFEALAGAPEPEGDQGEVPAGGSPARAGRPVSAAGLAPPRASKVYADLESEYQAWYDACETRPEHAVNVAYYVRKLTQGRPQYELVSRDVGDIPWAFIGVIHGMECGFNFSGHLHNGDPLTARTVRVPAGRPVTGSPPFTWAQSARDALVYKGFHEVTDWSVPRMLYLLEKYNGFGYRMRNLPTPYLWSFSNLYSKGKFVRDGEYDPNAISKQCGAALMLKAVLGSATAPARARRRGR
jgi:lysozyme family protein